MKKVLVILLAITVLLMTCGCQKQGGSIRLAGSTSMEKLCEALAESYMSQYFDVVVNVEYTGSSAGLEALANQSVDIGNSSRRLKDGEKEKGLVENVVAIDGIAVITNKSNTITNLTSEQLKAIYQGEITNWSQINGKDEVIVVIGREAGSGTRDAFEELLGIKDLCQYAQQLDSTGAVLAKVATIEGAIGYVSFDVVDETVIGMNIDGVALTEQNIIDGSYLLQRPFVMATRGRIDQQNDVIQSWFRFLATEEGKSITKKVGLIIPQ